MAFPTITEKHGWTRCGTWWLEEDREFGKPIEPADFLPETEDGTVGEDEDPGWFYWVEEIRRPRMAKEVTFGTPVAPTAFLPMREDPEPELTSKLWYDEMQRLYSSNGRAPGS